MSDPAPSAPQPEAPQPEAPAASTKRGRLGPLPIWLWIVLGVVIVALLVVLGFTLADGGRPTAAGSASPGTAASTGPASASASPSATPTASATPTPASAAPTAAPNPTIDQGTFDSTMPDYLSDTLNSQNTSVLADGGTFSNPVYVATPSGGSAMTPDDAVAAMSGMFTPDDPNAWDLALPESTLDAYRAGPEGAYFPVGAIVARSHDGHVFSFIGHDKTITAMFLATSESQLK